MITPLVSARAVRGEFRLRAERDQMDRTVLTDRHAAGAYHLSKPYWDGRALMVQWINPTAGIFAGDVLTSEVSVGKGAALLLTTPSATRIHRRMKALDPAGESHLRFDVDTNGWLEVQSEWLIPQSGSAFTQRTEIDLHQEAGLFYTEMLAPGRVAHGEALEFDELDLRLRLRIDGKLIIQDRLRARHSRTQMLRDDVPLFIGTVLIRVPVTCSDLVKRAHSSMDKLIDCRVGLTMLVEGMMAARLTATSGLALKRGVAALRLALKSYVPALSAELRKL